MVRRRWRNLLVFGFALTAFVVFDRSNAMALLPGITISGWILLALIVLLGLYGLRKKLPFLPLGASASWLQFHIYTGLLAIAVFASHIGWRWPGGTLEIILGILFISVAASGLCGLFLSRTLPPRLSRRGEIVIFERIGSIREDTRERAEQLIKEASTHSESLSLANFYIDRLAYFFNRPRNLISHIFGTTAAQNALHQEFKFIERYVNCDEEKILKKLENLVDIKNDLDFQFAIQGTLKLWLIFHAVVSTSLYCFITVHIVVSHLFTCGL